MTRAITLLTLIAGLGISMPGQYFATRGIEYQDLRSLIDKTQTDLRLASDLQHGNKQNDRYHKAQDYLSKFDRSLSHGKYNKGALNDSIDGVKSILDHNTLQATARDALIHDLMDLKVARDRQ